MGTKNGGTPMACLRGVASNLKLEKVEVHGNAEAEEIQTISYSTIYARIQVYSD